MSAMMKYDDRLKVRANGKNRVTKRANHVHKRWRKRTNGKIS